MLTEKPSLVVGESSHTTGKPTAPFSKVHQPSLKVSQYIMSSIKSTEEDKTRVWKERERENRRSYGLRPT